MTQPGTETDPLRVAIVGSGPAGFYAAEHLLKQKELTVEVDMFDRLPTPFGLVRGGVAPDHQKIKSVTKVYDRVAENPNFRFYGNVEFGRDITLDDLRDHYHQIIYATGAQTDRNLNIPGEELEGSHAATEFVAWYNGHPDFRHYTFDLSAERAIVVGIGNVAVDVARILSRTPQELATTDIADYALEALRESNVREVLMLGRRGPAQAAYTPTEVKELGELADADAVVLPEEAELDPFSAEDLEDADRSTQRNVEIVQEFAARGPSAKSRKLYIRFLISPAEILGDDQGQVAAVRLVKNELYRAENGSLRPRATEQVEEVAAGLVFRSVGYRGVPLPGVPFREDWGTIPNEAGRILTEPDSGQQVIGEYCTGWIKRGPSGVIGTNKPDSVETVKSMLEDVHNGLHLNPIHPEAEAAEALVSERQPEWFSYSDWLELDEIERQRGEAQGRPRVKFYSVEKMVEALGKAQPVPK